jgi:hypothetical protein
VTRRAVDTSAAAAAVVGGGAVAAETAADTSYSARPVTVDAAKHSMEERIALQLAAADDFHMSAPLHHIPGKPSAYPQTGPSVAAEGTPVVAVAAVLVAEASSNIVAAVVEGS